MKKHLSLKAFAFRNILEKKLVISSPLNPAWASLATSILLTFFPTTVLFAEEDPIFEKCLSQTDTPAPWCYQEEIEKIGDPTLCENILKYWPKTDGVHGHCYYQLAIQNKDCTLCMKIKKKDIKKMCELDACK